MLAVVQRWAHMWNFAAPHVQDDKDIVLEVAEMRPAVKSQGLAIQFAAPALREDWEIPIAAVKNDERALKYASDRLRDNAEYVAIDTVRASCRGRRRRRSMLRYFRNFASYSLKTERVQSSLRSLEALGLDFSANHGRGDCTRCLGMAKQRKITTILTLRQKELPEGPLKCVLDFAGLGFVHRTRIANALLCLPVIEAFACDEVNQHPQVGPIERKRTRQDLFPSSRLKQSNHTYM